MKICNLKRWLSGAEALLFGKGRSEMGEGRNSGGFPLDFYGQSKL